MQDPQTLTKLLGSRGIPLSGHTVDLSQTGSNLRSIGKHPVLFRQLFLLAVHEGCLLNLLKLILHKRDLPKTLLLRHLML